jgi:transcriptional regulator with XRE-family HTH domain
MIENLKLKREALGLSRQELADLAGVKYSAVSTLEDGKRPHGGDETVTLVLQALAAAQDKRDGQGLTVMYAPATERGTARSPLPTPANGSVHSQTLDLINAGDYVVVDGEEGFFRFIRFVQHPSGSAWCDVYGGRSGYAGTRSFRPERVHAT